MPSLTGRSPRLAIVGFGAFIVAALLKFYSAAAFFVLLRESPRRFVTVAAVVVATAVWLVLAYGPELAIVLSKLPTNPEWTVEFNGKELPRGLAVMSNHAAPAIAMRLRLVLIAAMIGFAIVAHQFCTRRGAQLPTNAKVLLPMPMVIGAAVIVFCFLMGQNYLYRGIFLLPVFPGLFAVARSANATVGGFIKASCVLMAVCWMPPVKEAFTVVRVDAAGRRSGLVRISNRLVGHRNRADHHSRRLFRGIADRRLAAAPRVEQPHAPL